MMTNNERASDQEVAAQDLADKADRLIAAMESLAEKSGFRITAVETRQQEQERSQRRSRVVIVAMAASFAIDIILTIIISFIGWGVVNNNDQLGDVQERVGNEVLCPLYEQLLAAVNKPPEPGMSEEELKAREEGARVVRQGFQALNCEEK